MSDDIEAVRRRHRDGLFVSGYSPKDTGRLYRDISILLARIDELEAALEASEDEKHTWWEAAQEDAGRAHRRALWAEARVARLETENAADREGKPLDSSREED